ncbi:MAG: hypothetical protein KKD97_10265 [Gammaproteobacteria bacterium]|nr:hypothetical protein [Gammaproteobacteria bacterium]
MVELICVIVILGCCLLPPCPVSWTCAPKPLPAPSKAWPVSCSQLRTSSS